MSEVKRSTRPGMANTLLALTPYVKGVELYMDQLEAKVARLAEDRDRMAGKLLKAIQKVARLTTEQDAVCVWQGDSALDYEYVAANGLSCGRWEDMAPAAANYLYARASLGETMYCPGCGKRVQIAGEEPR